MLRQAAVDAITARGHREEARGSLSDPYPRVRARAAAVLAGDPDSLVERATLARRDTWPMVRAEAVTSLRTESDAIPVIVASVDDSMSLVRAAAIAVLAASSYDQGWERVHQRLGARNEWPEVTAAAIDLCGRTLPNGWSRGPVPRRHARRAEQRAHRGPQQRRSRNRGPARPRIARGQGDCRAAPGHRRSSAHAENGA